MPLARPGSRRGTSVASQQGGLAMKVTELMTRDVAWVAPDASAFDAARLMWQHDCGFVRLWKPRSRQVLGVGTDRDICMAGYTQGASLRDIPIGRLMSRGVVQCTLWDDLEQVHAKLRGHQVHRLPVIDEH